MNLSALGGWWRIWCVVSLMWVVFVVAIGGDGYPQYSRSKGLDGKILSDSEKRKIILSAPTAFLELVTKKHVVIEDNFQLMVIQWDDEPKNTEVAAAVSLWEPHVKKALFDHQFEHFVTLLKYLFALPAILVFAGVSANWIYRGFRKGKSHG